MEDMRKATKDLPEVRREMCRLIDEDTIIIGHGYVPRGSDSVDLVANVLYVIQVGERSQVASPGPSSGYRFGRPLSSPQGRTVSTSAQRPVRLSSSARDLIQVH
jgi:hypothetical protein